MRDPFHVLTDGTHDEDRKVDHLSAKAKERQRNYTVQVLNHLGYQVALQTPT